MSEAVKIENLSVSYPYGIGKERQVINGLNLSVNSGEILGILGPNGAGKTTLIKAILGLIGIKSGSVSILGMPCTSETVKFKIGYMPEIANYYWFLTPEETLQLFGGLSRIDKRMLPGAIGRTIDLVGLTSHKKRLVKELSKGMQVRLNLAQALLHDPDVLFLDEPFSGLDPLGRIHFKEIIKGLQKQGKTVLLSSHELSEAETICDYTCIMKDGNVLQYGELKDILREKGEKSLEQLFLKIIGELRE